MCPHMNISLFYMNWLREKKRKPSTRKTQEKREQQGNGKNGVLQEKREPSTSAAEKFIKVSLKLDVCLRRN